MMFKTVPLFDNFNLPCNYSNKLFTYDYFTLDVYEQQTLKEKILQPSSSSKPYSFEPKFVFNII
jgi:hypothetical protein